MTDIRNALLAFGASLALMLCLLGHATPGYAAGYVGICDPTNPSYCAQVNSSGQLSTTGSGGGAGGAITAASGSYASGALSLGSIVDLGTGASPGANTLLGRTITFTNANHTDLTTLNSTLGSPMQQTGGTVGITGSVTVTCSLCALESGGNLDSITANTSSTSSNTLALKNALVALGQAAPSGSVPTIQAYGTAAATGSLATSKVISAGPGVLKYFQVAADSTLSSGAWEILILNSATDPGNGSVTPVLCYQFAAGSTGGYSQTFFSPVNFATGITIVVSTATSCFTETTSAHAFITGVQ